MPEKRKTKDGKRTLRTGEYERGGGFQFKIYDKTQRRYVSCSAPTLDELRKKEDQVRRDVLNHIRTGRDTLNDCYEVWKQTKRVRKNVMNNYTSHYERYVAPVMGKRKINDITNSDITIFYLNMLDKGAIGMGSLKIVNVVLHQIFEQARKDRKIPDNPCNGAMADINRRYGTEQKRIALTYKEQERLINVLAAPQMAIWRPPLLLMLRTGLRVGELCGLVWDDIDEKEQVIHVRRNLVYIKNEGIEVHEGKTDAARRDIPITEDVGELLDAQRALNLESRVSIDGLSDFVFVNRFGSVFTDTTMNNAVKRVIKQANAQAKEGDILLPPITAHSLRHTYCSNLVAAGVDVATVSQLMGHKHISTTVDIYTTIRKEQLRDGMETVKGYAPPIGGDRRRGRE